MLVGAPALSSGETQKLRELGSEGATLVAWQHSRIVQDRFPSPDIQKALGRLGIPSVTLAELLGAEQDFAVEDAVIAWMKAYGRGFRKRYLEGALVFWWWAELYLYHETPLRLAVRDVEVLARLLADRTPRRIVVVHPVRALEETARALGKGAAVEILGERVKGPLSPWRTTRLHLGDLLKMLGTGLKSLVRRPLRTPARDPGEGPRVFFLTHASMWRSGREMYFDEILPAVEEHAQASVVAFGPPAPFGKRRLGAILRDVLEIGERALPYTLIRRYFSFALALRLVPVFGRSRKLWRSFRAEASLEHQGVPLGDDAWLSFRDTFYRQLPWAVRTFKEVSRALEVEKPDVLVLYAESSGLGRAAVLAAREAGVPSFAVQHGIMYPHYYSHEHAPDEVGGDEPSVPLPTKTAVFGSLAKELLVTRGHYPEDRIVITGSPKFDALVRAAEGYDREAVRRALAVPEGEKFLVLASRWTAVGPVFAELVAAVEALDGVWLFIKPHQAESTGPYDDVLTRARPARCQMLPAERNLLELLFASDALVTVDSFASSEALVLGRLVLVVNLPNHLGALVEKGVALGVARGEPIGPVVRKLLFDRETAEELEARRKAYIQEFAFGADGRSTERIVRAILDTCKS